MELKTSIYADANIPEYWILSLSTKEIVVFRYPQNGQYTSVETIAEGIITPLAFPDIQVSVKQLLG
ncbi:Uma2 family endonuclease [Nostoc piscinale]|uniref:Uma2 family endonuclease n=1 Tax=Nostoc piscinale TaxID=224012 RepID=UPI000A423B09